MDYRERLHDPVEELHVAMDSRVSRIWTALPGIITKVDHTKMIVEVQPAIQARQALPNGAVNLVSLPVVPDVPIIFPSGGGYTLTFPVKAGDHCLLHFASRNIDGWYRDGTVSAPLDNRMHDLSDAFATVGPRSQAGLVENVSTTTTQLRSDDGTITIELDSTTGQINMKSPIKIVLDTPALEVTGSVTAGTGPGGPRVTVQHHVHAGGPQPTPGT